MAESSGSPQLRASPPPAEGGEEGAGMASVLAASQPGGEQTRVLAAEGGDAGAASRGEHELADIPVDARTDESETSVERVSIKKARGRPKGSKDKNPRKAGSGRPKGSKDTQPRKSPVRGRKTPAQSGGEAVVKQQLTNASVASATTAMAAAAE